VIRKLLKVSIRAVLCLLALVVLAGGYFLVKSRYPWNTPKSARAHGGVVSYPPGWQNARMITFETRADLVYPDIKKELLESGWELVDEDFKDGMFALFRKKDFGEGINFISGKHLRDYSLEGHGCVMVMNTIL